MPMMRRSPTRARTRRGKSRCATTAQSRRRPGSTSPTARPDRTLSATRLSRSWRSFASMKASGARVDDLAGVQADRVSDQRFYRWQTKYGALKEDDAHRLKALEAENSRLKRIVADPALDISMLKDLQKGKRVSPSRRLQVMTG